jgi:hypothetical protein
MSTLKAINLVHPTSPTNNIVLDASGNMTAGGTMAMSSSFMRNRIINGAMVIDQRNNGASVTPTASTYIVDRWEFQCTQSSKVALQRASGISSQGFTNSLSAFVSATVPSPGGTDYFAIRQAVEGLNCADFFWGTASAQTVTMSFWVQSSVTGTFGGSFTNSAVNRSYPFTYSISAANTWEKKTITIAGDTSGTWLQTNGVGINIFFTLCAGSTYSGTAGAWGGTFYASATGATNLLATSSASFYITGVQLEVGTVATPFEREIYSETLAKCQRYLPAFIPSSTGTGQGPVGQAYAATNALVSIPFQTVARVFPTGISVTNATNFAVTQANTTRVTASAVNFNGGSTYGSVIDVAVASGLVAGNATVLWVNTLPCQILFTGCEL